MRRTVEQNVDAVTFPSLGVPEPQMGDRLVEVLQKIDTVIPEQVTAVPKISYDSTPQGVVDRRRPQEALRSCPFPRCSRMRSRSLPFLVLVVVVGGEVFKVYLQDRVQRWVEPNTLTFQFRVVVVEVSKVFTQDRIQQRFRSRSKNFLFLLVVFTVSPQDRVSQRFWMLRPSIFTGFLQLLRVRRPQPARVQSCPPVAAHGLGRLMTRMRSSSWTMLAASGSRPRRGLDPLVHGQQSWLLVELRGEAPYWWNLDTQHTQWLPPWES